MWALPGEGVDMEQPDTQKQIHNTLIKLELVDITTLYVDAVVNAAKNLGTLISISV